VSSGCGVIQGVGDTGWWWGWAVTGFWAGAWPGIAGDLESHREHAAHCVHQQPLPVGLPCLV